ncbi:MAG: hypothetical protein R3B13_06085 [Polyangiaceae bacterium]
MTYSISTKADGTFFRHELEPLGVTLLDRHLEPASATVTPAGDDYDCAVSLPTRRLAIGYWASADLTIHDLDTGRALRSYPVRRVAPLAAFSSSGRQLLLQTGPRVVLLDLDSGEPHPLVDVHALDRLVRTPEPDEVILASARKDEFLRLSLATGDLTRIPVSLGAAVVDVKVRPHTAQLVAITRKKAVVCLDASSFAIRWTTDLRKVIGKDHLGVGQFCGDGSLFGCAVAARDHNYTVVLSAENGCILDRFDDVEYGHPHDGTTVRSSESIGGSPSFSYLDLATGTVGAVELGG